MSYCRFGEHSDVYVFPSVGGWLECCGCILGEPWEHGSTQSMIDHLERHRAAGHEVPDIDSDLWAEDAENFPPGCADGHDWGDPYQPHPDLFPGLWRRTCSRCEALHPDSMHPTRPGLL